MDPFWTYVLVFLGFLFISSCIIRGAFWLLDRQEERFRKQAARPNYITIPLRDRTVPGVRPLPELTAQEIRELHDARRAITGESTGGIRNG
jgi:hypothetical protein